ncbi:MAG TPA: peptidylprolyl isomerase [Rhizobacter sp.]|nr:peptidylprolyl isomerase [Rhizobacter sp.]
MSPIRSSRRVALLIAVLGSLLLAACKPAVPPEPTPPPTAPEAIALLDGQPIHRDLLDAMARQRGGTQNPYDLPTTPAPAASATAADRQAMLDDLVDIELLARKARERGLDRQPSLQAERELQAKTILAQAMVREQIAGLEVSDAELAAAYEERVPPNQFKVAHILVKDAATAQTVLDQLNQGKPFAELARRHSLDTGSRKDGGSLGWLLIDQMPTDLAAAIRHLKPGQHAPQALQTPQGFELVQLQALEAVPERPTLQTARAWLHPQLIHAKVEAQQQQWRREAQIQVTNAP